MSWLSKLKSGFSRKVFINVFNLFFSLFENLPNFKFSLNFFSTSFSDKGLLNPTSMEKWNRL